MSAPVFDEAALTRLRRMISASRVEQLLALYLELSPQRIAEVREGLEQRDMERVGRALHDMKSSAGMLGARRVEQLALEMERRVAERDLGALEAKLPELSEAVSETERRVNESRSEG